MRIGRLQSSTLSNILHSLETKNAEAGAEGTNVKPPISDPYPRLQKQYIPTSADSPLYRLITLRHDEEEADDDVINPQSENEERFERLLQSFSESRNEMSSIQPSQSSPDLDIPERVIPVRLTQSSISLQTLPATISTVIRRESAHFSRMHSQVIKPTDNNAGGLIIPTSSDTIEGSIPITDTVTCSTSKNSINAKSDVSVAPKADWTEEYEHIDVDWSMQAMDVLYNATFFDYIRDERNLELSSIRLARIVKDYKPKQVAAALTWMIQGWTVENTAKLLRSVFSDWLPDLAGCVFALVCRGWPKRPQLSLCTAYIVLSEPAVSAALFIRTLTESWSKDDTIELISYLDNLLEVKFWLISSGTKNF